VQVDSVLRSVLSSHREAFFPPRDVLSSLLGVSSPSLITSRHITWNSLINSPIISTSSFQVKMSNGSFLELVNKCDNVHLTPLPRRGHIPTPYDAEPLVRFRLSPAIDSPTIGLLRPIMIDQLRAENARNVAAGLAKNWDIQEKHVSFDAHLNDPLSRTTVINELCVRWRNKGIFSEAIGPQKWRDELFPVFSDPFGAHYNKKDGLGNSLFEMERSACPLFGVVTYGVHLIAYEDLEEDIRIWVPRRANTIKRCVRSII